MIIPITGYAEQDGTFVSEAKKLQRIKGRLRPIGSRKTPVEVVTLTAEALETNEPWNLTTWYSIFLSLKEHTVFLKDIEPYSVDAEGVLIEPDPKDDQDQTRAT